VLAIVALTIGRAFSDARVRMVVVPGLVGTALSFGPAMPGYGVLYRWVPLLHGVRGAARFGFLLLVAISVLAGYGMAALRDRWSHRRAWPWFVIGILFAIHAEAWRAPIVYRPFSGIPAIYRLLAGEAGAIVAEFPFYTPATIMRNAQYVLNSTAHWKPIVNGYSGFVPKSYAGYAAALGSFPDEPSRLMLRQLNVTHVVVHINAYEEDAGAMIDALQHTPWVELLATEGDIRLYKLIEPEA
jgi:hypothetical protein